jgi:radical SAM protein with 4Fe4S-binding SPASM domain
MPKKEVKKKIKGCGDCKLLANCHGGCRAISYLQNNQDIYTKDPACYLEQVTNGC